MSLVLMGVVRGSTGTCSLQHDGSTLTGHGRFSDTRPGSQELARKSPRDISIRVSGGLAVGAVRCVAIFDGREAPRPRGVNRCQTLG